MLLLTSLRNNSQHLSLLRRFHPYNIRRLCPVTNASQVGSNFINQSTNLALTSASRISSSVCDASASKSVSNGVLSSANLLKYSLTMDEALPDESVRLCFLNAAFCTTLRRFLNSCQRIESIYKSFTTHFTAVEIRPTCK